MAEWVGSGGRWEVEGDLGFGGSLGARPRSRGSGRARGAPAALEGLRPRSRGSGLPWAPKGFAWAVKGFAWAVKGFAWLARRAPGVV
jgi:hypothetical protein